MVKGEQPAMAEHDCNHVSELFPRSSGLSSARNGKPSDSSRPSTSPRRLVKGKEDPVTQRLAELMQQLQEETEQLSFRCRARSSLTEDFATELNRSTMISPVITETTEYLRRSTGRRASAETSLDSKESVSGTSHISLADGSPGKELVEQSFWSLLPSESHWRRTMESNKMLQSGDDNFRSTTDQPFRKCQEAGMPIFGSQDAFSRFTLEMAQQYLKEEELRSRHQTALFRLRERALREKTKAELAWLEHQKTHLRDKGQDDKMPAIIRKQREILVKLQQEKAEIRHLQNVYRAAHQERKLLLKQQQEIFRIHQTTAHLQSQLVSSSTGPRVSGMKATLSDAAAINQSGPPASSDPGPGTPDWDVRSSSPLSGSESEGSVAMEQLRKMYGWLDERFLTKKEKELVRRRRQAEDLLEWKQRLDEEELAVDRIETEAVVAWSPQSQEQVPGMRPPVTATDHWDDEEGTHSRESKKPFGTGKVVTSAADVPLDEQIRGPQNAKPPAESLAQMSTIVLEPSEKSAKEVAEIQADKGLPIAVLPSISPPVIKAEGRSLKGFRQQSKMTYIRDGLVVCTQPVVCHGMLADGFRLTLASMVSSCSQFHTALYASVSTFTGFKSCCLFLGLAKVAINRCRQRAVEEVIQPDCLPVFHGYVLARVSPGDGAHGVHQYAHGLP
uniref:centrosome-associated protein 350-like n=1 Tax=Pristiophorus japonicus TaxID=55135 RepID=UPI00398F72E2